MCIPNVDLFSIIEVVNVFTMFCYKPSIIVFQYFTKLLDSNYDDSSAGQN